MISNRAFRLAAAALLFSLAPRLYAQNGVRLPLLWNAQGIASVAVAEGPHGKTVASAEVLPLLQPLVQEADYAELQKQLAALPQWPLGQTVQGVTLTYSARQVAVAIAVARPRPTHLALRQGPEVPLGQVVVPGRLSAFANIYAGTGYTQGGSLMPGASGRTPASVSIDAAVNRKGWVLESRLQYAEKQKRPWYAQNTRLVRDVPGRMMRYQAGELSYPTAGFQRFTPLLGVGGARNFDLQPYRITRPAGRDSFTLNAPATVDVIVNGVRTRTLQLQPGVYELSDFPVASGSNDVKLVITDASGRREEKSFPIVSDGALLAKDLSEFTYNLGLPVATVNNAQQYKAEPTISTLWRKGVTGSLTVGANLQGSLRRQLAGLENMWANRLGMFHGDVAVSRGPQGTGQGARLEYRNLQTMGSGNTDDFWQASMQYQSGSFNLADSTPNPYSVEAQASYTHAFNPSLTGSLRTDYRLGRDSPNDYRAGASLYYRITSNLWASLDGNRSLRNGNSLLATLSWSPSANTQLTGSYDAPGQQWRTDWTQRGSTIGTGLDATTELTKKNQQYELNGSANYTGQRGRVGVRQERTMNFAPQAGMVGGNGTNTQFTAATALVYADGIAAISKPVANSFAIVQPRAAGNAVKLNPMQNPDGEATYLAESDWLGPAVLADLTPYTYFNLNADTLHDVSNTLPDRSALVLFPNYKSGTRAFVGKPTQLVVTGTLFDVDGKPLGLTGGSLARTPVAEVNLDTIEPAAGQKADIPGSNLVFTNREGYFRIDGLTPGTYAIALQVAGSGAVPTITFTVPPLPRGQTTGNLDLGDIHVGVLAGRQVTTVTKP